jgi:protein O-GlcNAc transferase
VRTKSDAEVARLLSELKVDIAVDLKGYTQDCRPRILAHRPAPMNLLVTQRDKGAGLLLTI